MKKTCHENLQRQIDSLISLMELCLPFVEKIKRTENKLDRLPHELEFLKQQAELLENKSSLSAVLSSSSSSLEAKIQETEFKIDFLVDDLEEILVDFAALDIDLKNLLTIGEKLEAIQEERIDNITSERIYKLLEKQQDLAKASSQSSLSKKSPFNWRKNWKQKIATYYERLNHQKTALSLAILVSLSLGWLSGYASSSNSQLNEIEVIEETIENAKITENI